MPAGTWNLGRLRKRVDYVGLRELSTIQIRDNTPFSDDYFNITKFPDILTGGKNLFKIKANSDALVQNSQVHIEVLDSNGNPIYYEPLNYIESDGTRVIGIWIYPDTPTGTATVYVGGRAKQNIETGQNYRSSQNINSPHYFNLPNILWKRTVTVAPNQFNTTEIIFTNQPQLTAREVIQPYLQPINLTNVAVQKPGTGMTVTVNPIPGSTSTSTTNLTIAVAGGKSNQTVQGAMSMNTPGESYGFTISPDPQAFALADDGNVGVTPGKTSTTMTTTTVVTVLNESRMETSAPFFSSSMNNGIVKIRHPQIQVADPGALQGTGGYIVPKSQDNEGFNSAVPGLLQLSGSYDFVVDTIFDTKKADVVLIGGFKNATDNATGGKWSVTLNATGKDSQTNDVIQATSDFTASYTEPFITQMTEQSQSFAEIRLSNIEPATGDVYRVKTLYKAGGMFGDFVDAGDTILEQLEVLEDTGSFEANAIDGAGYNRIGFFTQLGDYETYFTSSGGAIAPEVLLTPTFEPDDLMSGIRLSADSGFDTTNNRFGYVKVKDLYKPYVEKNTSYLFRMHAFADDTGVSTNTNITRPRMDVYMSGSTGNILPNVTTVDAYVLTDHVAFNSTLDEEPFADGHKLGTRVGTLEFAPSASLLPAVFKIDIGEKSEKVDLYLVPRRGRWNIANLSLKTFNESKFTPNFTRINTRIPTEFLNTPMTFKFQFFDITGKKADTEAYIYPIEFTGDNLVIGGNNNLLSGSVYIGNAVGSGIELAGVSSGFIRSIGYGGFTSASRTDQPGGFLLYSGSVLTENTDDYSSGGVGLEIVAHSESYFRFATTGTNAGLDIRTPKFFMGSDSQFVSGANGNIEISSSNFHLNNEGDVIMQGTISATAGGDIGGWGIGTNELSSSNRTVILDANGPYHISASGFQVDTTGAITASRGKIGGWLINSADLVDSNNRLKLEPDGLYIISSSDFQVSKGGEVTASAGHIGGFTLTSTALTGGSSGTTVALTPGTGIHMGHATFGSAPFRVTNDGTLTAQKGLIGGWAIDSFFISGGEMFIRNDGTIESKDFASNVAGSGFRLTAASGGFLEVENARIRGTLSTAVFEKESVNAVGGQLYVANSTTLTGSALHLGGFHSAATTTMSVANVSGFSQGEILTLKKIHSTGFNTEYIGVQSSSRFNKASETDFGGYLFVTRSIGTAGGGQTSGSLGETPGAAQSYTGSQVVVSTGKIGTGYIRLNANPNDPYTPYIDIVERTGSSIYAVDLKARLGDLSGLSQGRLHGTNPASAGHGLYSQNVFLEGGIVANTGSIGGIQMGSSKLFVGNGTWGNSNTGFYVDQASSMSLGDKLTWDGTDLTIQGTLKFTDGSSPGAGMNWSGSWAHGKTYYVNDAVEFSGSSYIAISGSHVAGPLNKPNVAQNISWSLMASTGSDGVIGSDGVSPKVVNFTADSYVISYDASGANPSPASITLSGSSQNFTDAYFLITGGGSAWTDQTSYLDGTGANATSSTFTSPATYAAAPYQLKMSVQEGSSGGEAANDTLSILSVKPGLAGANAASASLVSLESSTLIFVKAIDGTITPATASLSASLQNTASPTASWTTVPAVTLYTGSHGSDTHEDLTRMILTSENFGTNTSVKVTVSSASYSDSTTIILVDEGTGNVQSVLSNPTHTFQAAYDGTVSNYTGGETEIKVYEGATELTYESTLGDVTAGEFHVTVDNDDKITKGSFSGDGTTTALLGTPSSMTEKSASIRMTISGSTQNGTLFNLPVTQSFAKSLQGNIGGSGSAAKVCSIKASSLIFVKSIAGVITPLTSSLTASLQNSSNDGTWTNVGGTLISTDNAAGGPPYTEVTRDNVVDGMTVTYTMHASDGAVNDTVTLKILDEGTGNVQPVLSNATHTFGAASNGTVSSFVGGGTTLRVFEGATALTYENNAGDITAGEYSASLTGVKLTPGTFTGDGTTTATLSPPSAMTEVSGTINILIHGKTQNNTAFTSSVSQSFVKSLAGESTITSLLSNQSHVYVAASSSGNPITSYVGGETQIQVYEGAEILRYESTLGDVTAGEFNVIVDNDAGITAGSFSGDGSNTALLGTPSSMTELTASIRMTITGSRTNGADFALPVTQSFAKAVGGIIGTAGSDGATGPIGPNFAFLTGSLSTVNTTGGLSAGLLMNSTHFGFHKAITAGDGTNAVASDFLAYLDSSGNFILNNASAYFAWDNSSGTLLMSGSKVELITPEFFLGHADKQYLSGSGGNLEISSSKFHMKSDGDVIFGGSLSVIGNVPIEDQSLNAASLINFPSNRGLFPLVHYNFNHPKDGIANDTMQYVIFNQAATASGHTDTDDLEVESTINHLGFISSSFSNELDGGAQLTKRNPFGSGSDAITGRALKLEAGQRLGIHINDRYPFYETAAGGTPDLRKVSLSTWFKCNNVTHPHPQTLIELGGTTHGVHIYVSESFCYFAPYEGSGDNSDERSAVVSASINSQQWYHAVGVFESDGNSATSSIYLNGDLVQRGVPVSEGFGNGISNFSGYWGIGSINQNTNYVTHNSSTGTITANGTNSIGYFTGSIDEVRIYSGSLTALEVQALYDYPQGEQPLEIANLPYAGTFIGGDRIRTGLMESNNWPDSGSQFSLDDGQIKLGGDTNPGFHVTSDGFVKATNLSEHLVTLTSANASLYYTASGKKLVLDGSLGGQKTTNIRIDYDPGDIDDIVMPTGSFGSTTIATTAKLIIGTTGIKINEASVLTGGNNEAQFNAKFN